VKGEYYVTTFCNFAHRLSDGRPIGPPEGPNGKRSRHDCSQLSPTKLRLERDFGANAVEGSMTEFFPGEAEALAEDDDAALDSLYWQHAPVPKCWLCKGRGYIEAPDEFSAVHTEQLNCPVCDRNPLRAGALLPVLPLTGYAYLVQWFDHDAGNNVLIARTLAQMRKMVQIVADRHPCAEVLGGDWVQFVRPPDAIQALYADVQQERTEYSFWRWIELRLSVLQEQGKALPEPLGLCHGYKRKRGVRTGARDDDHSYCSNCTYGVTVRGHDPKEWYAKRQGVYYAGIARKILPVGLTMAHPQRCTAMSPSASKRERLYYVSASGDQNAPRTRIHPVPTTEAEQRKILGFSNQPALWFERLGDYPDTEASKKILAAARAKCQDEADVRAEARLRRERALNEQEEKTFLELVVHGQEE
jgi:hypothetical protein